MRFRSAVTGEVGRNLAGVDPLRLARVAVRASDPIGFFQAKLNRAAAARAGVRGAGLGSEGGRGGDGAGRRTRLTYGVLGPITPLT